MTFIGSKLCERATLAYRKTVSWPGHVVKLRPDRACLKTACRPGHVVKLRTDYDMPWGMEELRPDLGVSYIRQCHRMVMYEIFDWHRYCRLFFCIDCVVKN